MAVKKQTVESRLREKLRDEEQNNRYLRRELEKVKTGVAEMTVIRDLGRRSSEEKFHALRLERDSLYHLVQVYAKDPALYPRDTDKRTCDCDF